MLQARCSLSNFSFHDYSHTKMFNPILVPPIYNAKQKGNKNAIAIVY